VPVEHVQEYHSHEYVECHYAMGSNMMVDVGEGNSIQPPHQLE